MAGKWQSPRRAPPVARIRGGLARWRRRAPCREARAVLSWDRPPRRFQRSERCIWTGGTDAPEEYKVSKHPPKNKRETIREALLIFSVAVQSVAVASRMIACTCTKTIEIEPKLGHFCLRYC